MLTRLRWSRTQSQRSSGR